MIVTEDISHRSSASCSKASTLVKVVCDDVFDHLMCLVLDFLLKSCMLVHVYFDLL